MAITIFFYLHVYICSTITYSKTPKLDGYRHVYSYTKQYLPPWTIARHIFGHPFWISHAFQNTLLPKMLTLKKTAFINLYTVIFLPQYYLLAYHSTLRYLYISLFLLICTNIKHLTLTKMAFINIYMVIMAPYYCHAY